MSWASKGKSDEEEEEEEEDEDHDGDSDGDEGPLRTCRLEDQEERGVRSVDEDVNEEVEHVYGSSSSLHDNSDIQHEADPTRKDNEIALVKKGDSDPEQTSPLERKDIVACQKPKIWSLAETATCETVKKPVDTTHRLHGADVGLLWADWAARNGFYIPQMYSTPGRL